ncbi:MAG: hypothetical protein ABI680_16625 [Chthoniobacteraceae bacterium]
MRKRGEARSFPGALGFWKPAGRLGIVQPFEQTGEEVFDSTPGIVWTIEHKEF